MLWRLQNGGASTGWKPKLAVVMVGTMNAYDNTAEEIADGIKAIIKEIRTRTLRNEDSTAGDLSPRRHEAEFKRARRKTRRLCCANWPPSVADDKQVFYLDLDKKFLDEEGATRCSGVMSSDGLNLNKKGYEIWAEAMEPKIEELMDEKN